MTDLSFQILLALAGEPLHGYGILMAVSARSEGRLAPATGTLYTAIRRLKGEGLIDGRPGPEGGRTGAVYRLTALGRRVAALESRRLASLVAEARTHSLLAPDPDSAYGI